MNTGKQNVTIVRRGFECGCVVLFQRTNTGVLHQVHRSISACNAEPKHTPMQKVHNLPTGRENAETARPRGYRPTNQDRHEQHHIEQDAREIMRDNAAVSFNPFAMVLAGVKVANDGSLRRGGRFVRL